MIRTVSSLVLFFVFSCSPDDEVRYIQQIPDSGLYITQQFEETDLSISFNIPYSIRKNYNGIQYTAGNRKDIEAGLENLTLHLDIAVPPNATASSAQPLIIIIHGGGFSAGNKEDFHEHALSYATAGYVAASINYRLTPDNTTNEFIRSLAVNHAVEDAMNAIRFLKQNASMYHIDPSRIAVIGSSAGGGIALTNAVGADELDFESDYLLQNAKVYATISTGATLTSDSLVNKSDLVFDSFDCPIMLFHNSVEDPVTGATWQDVLETKKLIDDSRNTCTAIAQPSDTHTVNLSLGGKYWDKMIPFLWQYLRLYEL